MTQRAQDKAVATFYNPRAGLWTTPARLAESTGLSLKEAKSVIGRQVAAQRTHKFPRKKFVPSGGPPGSYQADIMFMDEGLRKSNSNYGPILTVLNVNSRMAYARALKAKAASEVAAAMADMIKEASDMKYLVTDSGSEFLNSKFDALMKKHDIIHMAAVPGNHSRLARVDRFHLTLRTLLNRYMIGAQTSRWLDALPLVIQNYNNTTHTGTKLAPAKVSEKQEVKLAHADKERADEVAATITLKPGDKVRRLLHTDIFAKKSAPRWSKKVYTIETRIGANQFQLEGDPRSWKQYELQLVSGAEKGPPLENAPAPVSLPKERKKRATRRLLKREEIKEDNVIPAGRVARSRAPSSRLAHAFVL